MSALSFLARPNQPETMEAENDYANAHALRDQCLLIEDAQTWFPVLASCKSCQGYVFEPKVCDDVFAQFGSCGCFVAMKMELDAVSSQLDHEGRTQRQTVLASDLNKG
jgi:hypothetical protein|eukprot:CAMPEP_0181223776 /NCGR_PEP_ID=MMETSP1096-20121128/30738_1 /TAXON_ID=156174 ORGANISM="Chrysochromulina ericina, Strain CCMP281" /NCGR_SAMPLE_ID=MMETSP1096 /ASSEMBLY_ACC=CAM_ASM_000453 /LENGTH=107 /DNA_ID=CAMNT_0023316743 /DNA_START=28 /DNA_END=351 /DNA_ORIENTATION=+